MTLASAPLKAPVRIAAFAAVVAALGILPPLPVPIIPVPITAQTLGVMLAGLLLGPRGGAAALALFLALIALGFPLLAGGRGGLGVFAGPGAGFVLAWPFAAAATGWASRRIWARYTLWRGIACAVLGGILVTYAVGIPWLAAVAGLTLTQAAIGSAAFLPGDLIKAVLAAMIARLVRRGYPALQP
jgi:biotin transport system substrate-specific component